MDNKSLLHPLKLKRLEKGWTQIHLSLLSGVPQACISYAERGYPSLSPRQKELIAKTFKLPSSELFPGQNLWLEYERLKRELHDKNLTPEQYEDELQRICKELGL